MTFWMSQEDLGQNILLSLKRCSPTSRSMGSRSTPENHASATTNLNDWVITSLVTLLCTYQINSRPFKPSQSQRLANNCVSSSVWSTYIVTRGKMLLASCPINCFNLQKSQTRVERREPRVFWYNKTCNGTWSISGLLGLQCSVWNTYWFLQTTDWCSHIPKGQAHRFLFTKDEQLPIKLYHNW